jgi:hypothetical protein
MTSTTETTKQHTPGPWRLEWTFGNPWILTDVDERGSREIAWSDADYSTIVRAVNAHDALVAALENATATLLDRGFHANHPVIVAARAALRQAKEPSHAHDRA